MLLNFDGVREGSSVRTAAAASRLVENTPIYFWPALVRSFPDTLCIPGGTRDTGSLTADGRKRQGIVTKIRTHHRAGALAASGEALAPSAN